MARVRYWRRRPLTAEPTMKRALDESDVAEQLAEPRRVRITLGAAALMRQQNDRKIRPRRLAVQPVYQPAQIRGLDCLVGDHRKPGAALDLMHEQGEIIAEVGVISRLPDQRGGNRGVTALRRENDGPLGRGAGLHESGSSSKGLPSPI